MSGFSSFRSRRFFTSRDVPGLIWREKRVCPYHCGFITCEEYVKHCFECKKGPKQPKDLTEQKEFEHRLHLASVFWAYIPREAIHSYYFLENNIFKFDTNNEVWPRISQFIKN